MISCTSFRVRFLAWLALCVVAATAHATDYTEGPDLSGTFSAPTSMGTLTAGSNLLTGNVGISGDLDYVSVDVPANHVMSQIILQSYTSTNGTSFMGLQAGTAFTKPASGPGAAGASDLLGYVHFGPDPFPGNVGTNVLDDLAIAPGAMGFTPPLAAGPYTFWLQNTSNVSTAYQFDIMVTAIPEPSTLAILGLGATALLVMARRRCRALG